MVVASSTLCTYHLPICLVSNRIFLHGVIFTRILRSLTYVRTRIHTNAQILLIYCLVRALSALAATVVGRGVAAAKREEDKKNPGLIAGNKGRGGEGGGSLSSDATTSTSSNQTSSSSPASDPAVALGTRSRPWRT